MDERLRVLIEELRHMRAARKMTQEDLAKAISYSPSTVAMVETGARKPPPDFWALVDGALDTGGAFGRMLARFGSPQWMREWEANERQATVLRSYENTVVPGLLQTAAYARALFRSVGLFDEPEVERRVEALATLPTGEDVVYLDDQLKGQVIDHTEDVLAVRSAWESIQGEALPPRQSIDLLAEVAQSWS